MYEELEIEALMETFAQRKVILKSLNKLVKEINEDSDELKKLQKNEWTFSTIFSTSDAVKSKRQKMIAEQPSRVIELIDAKLHY